MYNPETVSHLRELVKKCATWKEAKAILEKEMEIHPDNVTRQNNRFHFWPPGVGAASPQDMEVSIETERIQTMDEVIEACKVDLDRWEAKGFNIRRGKTGFGWSARFAQKKIPMNMDFMAADFVQRAEQYAPKFPAKAIKSKPEGRLLELSIPDLHLAKLCWGKETGHPDYDIKMAAELYRKAVASLLESARGMGIGRILFPVGNDLMNSDNAAGTTTKGTPQAQSEDTRWKKTFMVACDLVVESVEKLAAEFPVDVVVISGNHDHERCFYLGQYIKSWFRNHPNVTVDNSATQRKYYPFGATLIGFTHGSEERPARLPLIMAQEKPQMWAAAKFKEWHLGHLHHEIVKEDVGCKVRWLPSLMPPDEWHASRGFIGNDQGAEGFVYDPKTGLIATLLFRA